MDFIASPQLWLKSSNKKCFKLSKLCPRFLLWGHPFNTYIRKIFWKTNISYPLIRKRTCTYQGVRNVSFSENFMYVLNEWPLFYFLWPWYKIIQIWHCNEFALIAALNWCDSEKVCSLKSECLQYYRFSAFSSKISSKALIFIKEKLYPSNLRFECQYRL